MVTDDYLTVSAFLADVQLLLANSRRFYAPSSDEYQQVSELEANFTLVLSEHGFGVGSSPPTTKGRSSSESSQSSSVSSADSLKSPLTLRIPKMHFKSTPTASASSPVAAGPAPSTSSSSSSAARHRSVSDSAPRKKPEEKVSAKSAGGARGKVTRSQAWIQEYLESGDPIKIYLASIYDYHDSSTGEYVAEPFLQLPSRSMYPEYYKVILQPMDLATMRRNVEVKGHQFNNLMYGVSQSQ